MSRRLNLNSTIGDHDLCAWQPVPGVTWVQTRLPEHAKRMAKRRDAKQVAFGVAGGYLRIFEFRHPLAWAFKLIERYTLSKKSANRPKTISAAFRNDRTSKL